jgi:DNA-binding CsgD family transcriptional regulator
MAASAAWIVATIGIGIATTATGVATSGSDRAHPQSLGTREKPLDSSGFFAFLARSNGRENPDARFRGQKGFPNQLVSDSKPHLLSRSDLELRKAKSRISALEGRDLRPDQVKIIAERLGVTEQEVVDMNGRLGGDVSLNSPIREEGDSGEWQDWLVDDSASQETRLAEREETDNRRKALSDALTVLNERERRIFEARRLADEPITLDELADELGVSRERIRQIEMRAFEKLQKAVKSRVAALEIPQIRGTAEQGSVLPSRRHTWRLAEIGSHASSSLSHAPS